MAIQFSSAQSRGLATLIEAGAKRRLADEYDGAQARGEVRSHGVRVSKTETVGFKDAGLTARQVHATRAVPLLRFQESFRLRHLHLPLRRLVRDISCPGSQ
jgi:hypothetical protein